MTPATATVDTPIGEVVLRAGARGLRDILLPAAGGCPPEAPSRPGRGDDPAARRVLDDAAEQLRAYFARELHAFELALDLEGRSPFQLEVIAAMLAVPYAAVTTYGDLARTVGRPRASQAVGQACTRNPLPIVVPCHRVIAGDGSLGGYAAGTAVKRRLLELERGAAVPPGGWEPAALRHHDRPGMPRLFDTD